MSLGKKKNVTEEQFKNRNEFPELYPDFNDTSSLNYSQWVDEDGNFNPREIDYELIDKSVYESLNQRFMIAGKPMPIIVLDRDFLSVRYENYQQYDTLQEYLSPPFFTMYRTGTRPLWRVNPLYKPTIYSIPKKKDVGVVYELYKMPPPRWEIMTYEFKFISNYRERANEFENQMNEYFKNKRNIITIDTGDRFVIKPSNQDERAITEKLAGSSNNIQRVYALTYTLEVIGYLRDPKLVEKVEKKSVIEYQIIESGKISGENIQKFTTRIIR